MLTELRITNFAIIDTLSLPFHQRMSVLSGETGAGKSIIMNALHIVLGGKAFPEQIRTDADSASVEALFQVSPEGEWAKRLLSLGVEQSGEVLLKRIVYRNGRSRQWINGQPLALSMLAEACGGVVEIASQHQYQSLLRPETHLTILDRFGGLEDVCSRYKELFEHYCSLTRELESLLMSREEKQRRSEYLSFYIEELRRADIREGEEEGLTRERTVLSSAERLKSLAHDAYEALYAAEGSVAEQLGTILKNVGEIQRLDSSLLPLLEGLQSATYQLQDAASTIQEYRDRIEYDPQRMEIIESRLEEIRRIKRKYGKTIQDIMKALCEMEEELRRLEGSHDREGELKEELRKLRTQLVQEAGRLSDGRRQAGKELTLRIERELVTLQMKGTTFEIRFFSASSEGAGPSGSWLHLDGNAYGPRGAEEVEFYLSTNVGEPPKPLRRIASGGELSRVVLVLQHILSKQWEVGTCVFDEVDTGIGGGVAEIVGRKLREIARDRQVICITHLPQIAVFADTHFHVYKKTIGRRTVTMVRGLGEKERVEEVARMLGGEALTQKTLQHAREMLLHAR